MISVFRRTYDPQERLIGNVTLTVTKESFIFDYVGYNLEVKKSDLETGIYDIMYGYFDKIGLRGVNKFRYCDSKTKYRNVKLVDEKLVRILYNAENGDVVFLVNVNQQTPFYPEETILDATFEFSLGFCREVAPWVEPVLDSYLNKADLLGETDPFHSLSYLEAEVDVLLKIVKKLAEKVNIEDEALIGFVDEADKCSVMNIKPIEALLSELDHKKALRVNQENFYKMEY